MLDRLLELVTNFIDLFKIAVVVKSYQQAVVLTLGVQRRPVLMPGLHFLWPLGIDEVHRENVVPNTHNLSTQKLSTKDGQQIAIGVFIRYHISDIVKALLDVEGVDNVIADSTYGETSKRVRASTWEQINSDEWVEGLHKSIRRRAFKYGVEIEETQITDLAKMRVLCIIGDSDALAKKPTHTEPA